jgi:hypothetical protein
LQRLLAIVNARTLPIELRTITCIGLAGQRSSIIDVVIRGLGYGIDSLSVIITDKVRTGSDREVITWELIADNQVIKNNSNAYDEQTTAQKLRPPIKTDYKD